MKRLTNIYQQQMNKRTIIEIVVGVLLFIGGFLIKSWIEVGIKFDGEVNILDAITLIVTIILGIYIAKILEKEVQDKRIEKDMYLAKIGEIENFIQEIEKLINNLHGSSISYKQIVNMEHRCRRKRNSIFQYIMGKANGKMQKQLSEYDNKLKTDFKDLRQMLTQTSACDEAPKDVIVENDVVQYSLSRTSEILSTIESVENELLEVRVIINNL